MQTHEDEDVRRLLREHFLRRLEERANLITAKEGSQITAGKPGEPVLHEWQAHGVHVRHLPDDEQNILRISVGGGETPVPLNYCVFRGSRGACVDLLRKALQALRDDEGD